MRHLRALLLSTPVGALGTGAGGGVELTVGNTAKALQASDLRKRFDDLGMAPVGNPPADFSKAIREESGRWAKVIKARKLEIN